MKTLDEQIEYMRGLIVWYLVIEPFPLPQPERDVFMSTCQAIIKTLEESRELREHRETTET